MNDYDFNDLVLIGARDISKKMYSWGVDQFSDDPNGYFLRAFLSNRFLTAEKLAC